MPKLADGERSMVIDMNTKTMEGLIGARVNMELVNTPMRVYKEARLKGDTTTMERSMGYVGEFSDKAGEYKKEADKGIEDDVKEAREKAEAEREEAVKKRREERKKFEEELEEKRNEDKNVDKNWGTNADTLEISENGKELSMVNINLNGAENNGANSNEAKTGEVKFDAVRKPLTYTKTGDVAQMERDVSVSVSV